MDTAFICSKCKAILNTWESDVCDQCGYVIRDENGIYIFTDDGNIDVESQGKKYIGFDVIAPNYDSSRDRLFDSEEGKAVGRWIGEDKVVLEIGAGTGYHSIPMAKEGCRVIAGDISLNMLKIMVSKMKLSLHKNLMPCKLNAYDLPLPNESIDVIFMDHVFHLIEEPEKVIHEMKRVLKPNGCFLNVYYSGEALSEGEESKKVAEINQKIDTYYNEAVKTRGLSLLERFGWISQGKQQEKLKERFEYYGVIEGCSFSKKITLTVQDTLSDFRNKVLVNQAMIDGDINNEIVDEIDSKLTMEYGKDYHKFKSSFVERTSVQIFK